MKKYIANYIKLINRDVGRESESNRNAVLTRILCTYSILYSILTAIILATNPLISICIGMMFCVGVYAGAFICTYESKVNLGISIYLAITLVQSAALTFAVGWKYFYAPIALICLFAVYFNLSIPPKKKILFSAIISVYLILLVFGYGFIVTPLAIQSITATLTLIANIFYIIISISSIAYFFCTNYMQSEEKIIQYNKKLEQIASTDPLTSLWNRRAMNEHLAQLVKEYKKYDKDFSIAIMDIDFFKRVNDEYGHGMGDVVLKSLAYLLKTRIENHGHASRWGGEEFLLTFEDMDFEDACKLMESLRKQVEDQLFTDGKISLNITITAGISEFISHATLDSLITEADEKLYIGKTSGRNRVITQKK